MEDLNIEKIWKRLAIVVDINSLTEKDQDVAFIMKKERIILILRVEFMGDVISLFEEDEIIKKIKKKETKALIILIDELEDGRFNQILRCKNLNDKEALATLLIGQDQLLTKIKGW